jgi:preprotein translocase subunit SecF
MSRFAQFGNDLYTGKRSIDFVGRAKLWYAISAVAISSPVAGLRPAGLNLGIEFTGGSEFRVSNIAVPARLTRAPRKDAVERVAPATEPSVTKLGADTVRVQTEKLRRRQSAEVREALGSAFNTAGERRQRQLHRAVLG